MAEQDEDLEAPEEELEEEPIRIPPGWGPILFLALVIVLSNVGLGLYVRSLVGAGPTRPEAGGPVPGEQGPGGPGGPGGMGGPAARGGPGGPGSKGGPDGPSSFTYTVDDAQFTPELDARIRKLAEENGLPADDFASARSVFEQMQRSGLLPQSNEVDLETALTGHILEMAKHRDDAGAGAAAGGPQPGGPAGGPPPGGEMKPPPDVQ